MAELAFLGSADMPCAPSRGRDIVMTTDTGAIDLGMIDTGRGHRRPGHRTRLVTELALLRGIDMGLRPAAGSDIIVTTDTTAIDLGVVHRRRRQRCPGRRSRLVAELALVTAIDVRCALSRNDDIVMTADTGAVDLGMIDAVRRHRSPGGRELVMTGITLGAGAYMGFGATAGGDAVMTDNTVAEETAVIDDGDIEPAAGVMAGITLQGGLHMGGPLATRHLVIMTTAAGAKQLIVVDRRWQQWRPRRRAWLMTSLAFIGGTDVRQPLPPCHYIVMTADAGADHLGVIDPVRRHRPPGSRKLVVTQFAGITAGDMHPEGLAAGDDTVVAGHAAADDRTMIHLYQ